MKIHTICMMFVIGVSGLSLLSTSCAEPDLLCDVRYGPYATKYFPKDPASDCLMLPGEFMGMGAYNPPNADRTGTDASTTTIAVQAISMGLLGDEAQATAGAVDGDPNHTAFSLGDYSNRPENDFCTGSNLSAAEQHIPETSYTDADGNPAVYPETRLVYDWSDLQVYMTFEMPGNAAMGEVTITREVTDPMTGIVDACTTTYVVSALFPAVGCEQTNAMGEPSGLPDDSRCCAKTDLATTGDVGSGIHPDFKVKCDPTLLQCVLDWRPGEAFPPLGGNAFCG